MSSISRSSARSSPRGLAIDESVIGSGEMDGPAWRSAFLCNRLPDRWIAFIADYCRSSHVRPPSKAGRLMQAIHVFWTAPYRARGIDVGVNLVMPPVECLVLAASV